MPCEERVMRAREVAALVERCRRASASRRGDPILLRAAEMLEALAIGSGLAPIADDGSGIGESRRPLSRAEKDAVLAYMERHCPHRAKETAWDAVSAFNAIFSASPDIDRSGLAQEVE